MAALVAGIHVLADMQSKAWMAGDKPGHDADSRDGKARRTMFSDPALAAVLTLKTLSIVWLGGFLGGMATGAAGFAYGIVATSIWLHAISPLHAAMLVVSAG